MTGVEETEDDQMKPGLLLAKFFQYYVTENLTVTIPILPKDSPKPRFNAMSPRPNSLSMFAPIPPRNISGKNKAKNQEYSVIYI